MMFPFRTLTVVVKDDERAFLTRDGRFERLLGPGRFTAFDPFGRLRAETTKVVRAEVPVERALLIEKLRPEVAAEHFAMLQTGANEVAIVSLDGEPKYLVPPSTTRVF